MGEITRRLSIPAYVRPKRAALGPDDLAEMKRMYDDGCKASHIASKYGVATGNIYRMLHPPAKIRKTRAKRFPHLVRGDREILKMIDAGTMGVQQIADEMGCARKRVHAVAALHGREVPRPRPPDIFEDVQDMRPSEARRAAEDALQLIRQEIGAPEDLAEAMAGGLTLQQARIYTALKRRNGAVVSHGTLYQVLDIHREMPGEVDPRIVPVRISQMRKIIADWTPRQAIISVFGVGYRLHVEAAP